MTDENKDSKAKPNIRLAVDNAQKPAKKAKSGGPPHNPPKHGMARYFVRDGRISKPDDNGQPKPLCNFSAFIASNSHFGDYPVK